MPYQRSMSPKDAIPKGYVPNEKKESKTKGAKTPA